MKEVETKTILVVEDEPLLLEVISELMQREGYRVLTAENGAVALDRMKSARVDLIVSDIRMPVMDGVTLIKAIKAQGTYFPNVVLVTGYSDISNRDAYDLGAGGLLPKPYEHEDIMALVRRSLTDREELWRMPRQTEKFPIFQAAFDSLTTALRRGLIAFGRGGFCARMREEVGEGRVSLEVKFEADHRDIVGEGIVRWVENREQMIGVEITSLADPCRDWVAKLAAQNCTWSFIPRSAHPVHPVRQLLDFHSADMGL